MTFAATGTAAADGAVEREERWLLLVLPWPLEDDGKVFFEFNSSVWRCLSVWRRSRNWTSSLIVGNNLTTIDSLSFNKVGPSISLSRKTFSNAARFDSRSQATTISVSHLAMEIFCREEERERETGEQRSSRGSYCCNGGRIHVLDVKGRKWCFVVPVVVRRKRMRDEWTIQRSDVNGSMQREREREREMERKRSLSSVRLNFEGKNERARTLLNGRRRPVPRVFFVHMPVFAVCTNRLSFSVLTAAYWLGEYDVHADISSLFFSSFRTLARSPAFAQISLPWMGCDVFFLCPEEENGGHRPTGIDFACLIVLKSAQDDLPFFLLSLSSFLSRSVGRSVARWFSRLHRIEHEDDDDDAETTSAFFSLFFLLVRSLRTPLAILLLIDDENENGDLRRYVKERRRTANEGRRLVLHSLIRSLKTGKTRTRESREW